mgnify:CR=1 FL=1
MDKNEAIDVAALRDQFLGKVFDEYVFMLDAEKLVQYAKSCGETASKYTDPNDPDFQSHKKLLAPKPGLLWSTFPIARIVCPKGKVCPVDPTLPATPSPNSRRHRNPPTPPRKP